MEGGDQPQGASAGSEGATPAEGTALSVGRRHADRVIVANPITKRAVDLAASASRSGLPAWVWGPPGSGRSFFGRAIHSWSARSQAPFESLACGATPEALQGWALFGSSARVRPELPEAHEGVLERVGDGTVLLEAADALGSDARARLFQALSQGRFRREGEAQDRVLRARVVATAERPPEGLPFGDLPHHEIALRALADRPEEILPMASHFLGVFARQAGVTAIGFTREARAALLEEPWPGNLAELRERIRQAIHLSQDGAISAEALLLAAEKVEVVSFREAKRAFETRYVTSLLRRCGGNVSQAARLAQKDRKDFYDVIRRTGVRPADFRR